MCFARWLNISHRQFHFAARTKIFVGQHKYRVKSLTVYDRFSDLSVFGHFSLLNRAFFHVFCWMSVIPLTLLSRFVPMLYRLI